MGHKTNDKVMVTPEMAAEILKGNTKNRSLQSAVVRDYADDMASGRWRHTSQGIAIADDGTLINGQHRLAAVIKCGLTVPFTVAYGCDPDDRMVADRNRRRSLGDMFHMEGERNTTVLAATIGWIASWEDGAPHLHGRGRRPSTLHGLEILERHPDLRRSVSVVESARAQGQIRFATSAAACVHYIVSREDPGMADLFTESAALCSGVVPGDPEWALHKWLAFAAQKDRRSLSPERQHHGWLLAWNARADGRKLKRIVPRGQKMPWPSGLDRRFFIDRMSE